MKLLQDDGRLLDGHAEIDGHRCDAHAVNDAEVDVLRRLTILARDVGRDLVEVGSWVVSVPLYQRRGVDGRDGVAHMREKPVLDL